MGIEGKTERVDVTPGIGEMLNPPYHSLQEIIVPAGFLGELVTEAEPKRRLTLQSGSTKFPHAGWSTQMVFQFPKQQPKPPSNFWWWVGGGAMLGVIGVAIIYPKALGF